MFINKTRKIKVTDNNNIITKKNKINLMKKIDFNYPNFEFNKTNLKIQSSMNTMNKRYNEEFIELMEKLSNIMLKQGEQFRARAYQKAQETIMNFTDDITSTNQLKGRPGIGDTIMEKFNEYIQTGTLRILEREKTNPINILSDIYGIGPKKAQELVDSGITSINELKLRQNELLNDIQQVGLKYYEQIQQRIPRTEIIEFNKLFQQYFELNSTDSTYEIVGSYRRGAQTSGDIDVIITGNNGNGYNHFVQHLINTGIILEVLSRGPSKTLVIAKLPGLNRIARRIDFLYTPPDEFAFAILYFTGSKIFNTVMRQTGLNKGYTFNEHGIYHIENKKKGAKVDKLFKTEKDIFDFLELEFKHPNERTDGRAVVPKQVTQLMSLETIINNFKQNGIKILEQLNETQLGEIIKLTNDKYYNDTPLLTDIQYDIIKEFIERRFPSNTVIKEIGAEVTKNKVRLPYEMASMDKIKPDTNALSKWLKMYNGPYVLSCKLDGVSGLYTTEGPDPKLYTRGDGIEGQDISYLIPYLRLPKKKGLVIRGEFIIPKAIFEQKYKTTFANPRNMVAGIINHKHINEAISDVHFVAYEVIIPQRKPTEQMELLKLLDVEMVLYEVVNTLSNDYLSTLLVNWRTNYNYEIDGIIVTNDLIYTRKAGNPEHAFAFKMVLSDQIAEANVVDVIWTPSKDGYLKPRVQIEPIQLGGVKIEYATGFNALFIKDNKIGIGATIQLIRSGDVIPYIQAVTVPAETPKLPTVPYKWNETGVDIMLENPLDDSTVKEKNITGFFRGIGVEGLSSGNITRLIDAGYDSVPKIINMTVEDFLEIDGYKIKLANKIYSGIHSKLDEASIINLMAASNIFGRGFSEKRMEVILDEIPDILVSDETDSEKIEQICEIKGFSTKTAEAFVSKIDDFKEFLEECELEDKLYEETVKKSVDGQHLLCGKSVVLTGTRDSEIIEFIKKVGAVQGGSVSKNTFLVIAKNKNEDTGKAEEARRLNIPIMSVEEFKRTYIV